LILGYGATFFRGDPVVIGIGMNLLASGLTAYLLRVVFGVSGTFSDPGVVGLGRIAIPALAFVPGLGWAFKELFGPLGITNIRTFADPQNPNRVALMMDVPDMNAMMAAMQTTAAADAMAFDGVVPESLVILVES
jgi:hypothetical protein